ncbi:MAG: ribulose bisphosphate carboxylase small subunit [Chromatiales bacterium]
MQEPKYYSAAEGDRGGQRILSQIEQCLRQGCVIRIEHTPAMSPRFTPWQDCGQSCCYNGDPEQVFLAIEQCREAHFDHHIRLVLEDFSCHSRFSFVVNSPVLASAA